MPLGQIILWMLLLPLVAGSIISLVPALSLGAWSELLQQPGLIKMLGLSLWVALASTLLALLSSIAFLSSRVRWYSGRSFLSPILSIPHSAIAIGTLFLLAPSGWLFRPLAMLLGWDIPPDWLTVRDPYGISLIIALWLKETPFLILMSISAANQLPVNQLLLSGRSLGYHRWQCWWRLIWPQLYPMIRSPLLIVLLFSISVVEVPLIIGPNLPPLFQVQIISWLQDPLLASNHLASSGSILLLTLAGVAVAIWTAGEKLLKRYLVTHWQNGSRQRPGIFSTIIVYLLWCLPLILAGLSLLVVMIRAFSWRWPYPDILPAFTLKPWYRYFEDVLPALMQTLSIGLVCALLGLILSIVLLQSGTRLNKKYLLFLYLPLILPQLAFIPGLQQLLINIGMDGQLISVILFHLLFVFPYCLLSLIGPWQQFDQRLLTSAQLLGHSPLTAMLRIRLPLMLQPLLTTFALGFAVSCALYLPTLFAGSGRISTLMTEAVALSSGGNRRLLALYACLQMLAPVIIWLLAIWLPRWIYRNKKTLISKSEYL